MIEWNNVDYYLFIFSERKKQFEKIKTEEKKKKNDFREKIEKEVNEFINDASRTRLRYDPMERISRTIL